MRGCTPGRLIRLGRNLSCCLKCSTPYSPIKYQAAPPPGQRSISSTSRTPPPSSELEIPRKEARTTRIRIILDQRMDLIQEGTASAADGMVNGQVCHTVIKKGNVTVSNFCNVSRVWVGFRRVRAYSRSYLSMQNRPCGFQKRAKIEDHIHPDFSNIQIQRKQWHSQRALPARLPAQHSAEPHSQSRWKLSFDSLWKQFFPLSVFCKESWDTLDGSSQSCVHAIPLEDHVRTCLRQSCFETIHCPCTSSVVQMMTAAICLRWSLVTRAVSFHT